MSEKSLNQHIIDDKKELENSNISPQRRRHIEDELNALEEYKKNHPASDHDPSSLEIYCDSNPDSEECRIYDI